jgi:hypothetical protein
MTFDVDIERSKASGKIRFNHSVLERFLAATSFLVFPAFIVCVTATNVCLLGRHGLPFDWAHFALTAGLGAGAAFVLHGYLSVGRLRLIPRKGAEKNLSALTALAEEIGWSVVRRESTCFIAQQPTRLFSWGSALYAFPAEGGLFIVVLGFTRGHMISPFHWVDNRIMEKRFALRLHDLLDARVPLRSAANRNQPS